MRRLVFLMSLFYLIQLYGANPGIFHLPMTLYLKESLGFSASDLAWFEGIVIIPWTIKPLWGIISDSFPLAGSTMKNWFMLCYFIAISALFALGFGAENMSGTFLLVGVLTLSTAIAFSDVLTDKLMVIEGKSLGKTGVLQAAQWSAFSFGGALMMYISGWIAANTSVSRAFLITALIPFFGLIAAPLFIQDSRGSRQAVSPKTSFKVLWRDALKNKEFLAVAVFIVALTLHIYPPIIYYQRDVLGFGEQFLGTLGAMQFLAGGVAAVIFGFFIAKISRRALLNIVIGLNVISTLGLIAMYDELSALVVYAFIGFTGMVALLGVLEFAAKICPVGAEGTSYALLMSVLNLSGIPGTIVGGVLWEQGWSFASLVLAGSALTALCWLIVPFLGLERE